MIKTPSTPTEKSSSGDPRAPNRNRQPLQQHHYPPNPKSNPSTQQLAKRTLRLLSSQTQRQKSKHSKRNKQDQPNHHHHQQHQQQGQRRLTDQNERPAAVTITPAKGPKRKNSRKNLQHPYSASTMTNNYQQ